MKSLRLQSAWLCAAVLILSVSAQAQSCLTTTLAGGNGQVGAMFDLRVVGASPLIVDGFSVVLDAAAGTPVPVQISIMTAGGTHVGSEQNPAAWSTIGATTVVSRGPGVVTPIDAPLSLVMQPGETMGFYIRTDGNSIVVYTNGTVRGNVMVATADLAVLQGTGVPGSFGGAFQPRNLNMTVHFSVPNVAPEFQVNSPASSLTINGAVSYGCEVANSSVCTTGRLNLVYRSNLVAQPFDLAITSRPAIASSAGGVVSLSGTQVTNVDFSGFYWFLFGGSTFAFTPIDGNFNFDTIAPTNAGTMALQAMHINPASPDGFSMSQAAQVTTTGSLATNIVGDDVFSTIALSGAPLCSPVSQFSFFGQNYTEFHVSSNGRVMFGAGDTSPFADRAAAQSGSPFVGAWADFDQSSGGSIAARVVNGRIRVDWTSVPPYGVLGAPDQTWAIVMDPNDMSIVIESVNTFASVLGAPMFLGMSPGAPSATDPGAAMFTQTAGTAMAPTDMIYEFGDQGTLAPGITQITFVPDGLGNYSWIAQ